MITKMNVVGWQSFAPISYHLIPSPVMSFSSFRQSLTGAAAQIGEPEYSVSRVASNAVRAAKYVVYPATAEDVSKAILFAKASKLDLAICGRGHSTSAASSTEGGLVIDLSGLDAVRIDAENKLAYVQGGATCAMVDAEAIKSGLATTTAKDNTVGIGGMATAGGYSWLTGQHGLLVDQIVSATVVVANGDVLTCSVEENADLFWAIRGAGSNFGAVVEFVFKLHEQSRKVYSTTLTYSPALLPILVQQINRWTRKQSPSQAGSLTIAADATGAPSLIWQGYNFKGDFAAGEAAFKGFADLGALQKMSEMVPFEQVNVAGTSAPASNMLRWALHVYRTDLKVFKKALESFTRLVTDTPEASTSSVVFEFVQTDKLCDVPVERTAFAQRAAAFNVLITTQWTQPSFTNDAHAATYDLANTIASASYSNAEINIGYTAYADVEARTKTGALKAFGPNYERLQQVKAVYDPDLVFDKWFVIQPSA